MAKKRIFLIISILAVVLAATSIASYSIANLGNDANEVSDIVSTETVQRGASIDAEYITNIDLIIQNSNLEDEPQTFNIVEITPANVGASALTTYVANGLFKQYVIDANSETDPKGVMAADMIRVDTIKVSATTDLQSSTFSNILGGEGTIQEVLDTADLIYVSCPSYTSYDGNNNMSEAVYNYLHTYALGDNKPIIVDFVTTGSSSNVVVNDKTYADAMTMIASNTNSDNEHAWNQDVSGTDFFAGTLGVSTFVPYDTNSSEATGKFLIVTTDEDEAATMYKKLQRMDEAALIAAAYYGNNKPEAITYTVMSPENLTSAAFSTTGHMGYDMVFFENNIMASSITNELYATIKTLSDNDNFLIYDKRATADDGGAVDGVLSNYIKLLELLCYENGTAKYTHVLSTTYGLFDTLNSEKDAALDKAKKIADILNNGDYRGSNSNGAGGKVYRVLELQPCYPIDLELARTKANGEGMQYSFGAKGDYYTEPAEVRFGVTEDEIEEGTEYYAFELSKAKIAEATGLSMKQIVIDQMSTDEFISSKEVLIETYDLIYIGGNKSALIPNIHTTLAYLASGYTATARKLIANFEMFTHTGRLVPLLVAGTYNTTMNTKVANTPGQTTDDAVGAVYINGKKQPTSVEMNGNDITKMRYDELVQYVKAGMPIIVEKHVAEAFEEVKALEDNRLAQLATDQIDPDSWMYKALDYIYEYDQKGGTSVEWNLDAVDNEVSVDNADGTYGETLSGNVTLFDEETNNTISALVSASNIRPTLTIKSAPKEYSQGNLSSYNSTEDGLVVEAFAKSSSKTSDGKFKIALYIDVDGNSAFKEGSIEGEGERADIADYTYKPVLAEDGTVLSVPTVELSYDEVGEDFWGIVYYKVVAQEVSTGLSTSYSGYAFFEKPEDAEKKQIRVLQIMPRSAKAKADYDTAVENGTQVASNFGENDCHSLYFCTECQMFQHRGAYNAFLNGEQGHNQFTTQSTVNGVTMGIHEHKFGIVEYDSIIGDEDYESNLADAIFDDYDVDLDIMYNDEFEEIVATVQKSSADEIAAYKQNAEYWKAEWESRMKNEAMIAAEEALYNHLVSMQGNGLTMSNQFEQFAEDKEYYKVWFYNPNFASYMPANLTEYRTLYNDYMTLYNQVLEAEQMYKEYKRLAYAADKWMAMNYDMVVLGFAEDFGGEDLNEDACQMIADYVARGGSMLNTHDSTTKYEKAGAMNITDNLRSTFGMDRYHVIGTVGAEGEESVAVEGDAILTVDAFQYTSPEMDYVDTAYQFALATDNGTLTETYKVGANENFNFVWNAAMYDFSSYNKYNDQYSLTPTPADPASAVFGVTVNASAWGYDGKVKADFDYAGYTVTISKITYNAWGGVDSTVQVASGKLNAEGKVQITKIPRTREVVTAALTTKEYKYTPIPLKNTDKNITVDVVDSASDTNASITVLNGDEHTDITEKMTVTVQVNPPAGYEEEYLAGNTVSIIFNGRTYTRQTDAKGLATFEISQVPSIEGTNNISANSLQYRKFITDDAELYFFSEKGTMADNATFNEVMADSDKMHDYLTGVLGMVTTNELHLPSTAENIASNWLGLGYNSPAGLTDSYMMYNTGQNLTVPYLYVDYIYQNAINWDMGYELKSGGYGPNGASQVNQGIVTQYPFKISTELRISTTHSQTYALDMEDEEVAVWYTLSAGTKTTKRGASLYAASPHDGMDNYYLYSKGTVFYCGAGHSVVTGPLRDNNDERRLFINVIVNSVRNAGSKPKITLHEKDTNGEVVTEDKKDGNLFVDGEGEYYYTVNEKDEIPEFDFKVKVDPKAELEEVYVFYDLDYGVADAAGNVSYSDAYTANDPDHILIAQYNTTDSETLKSKELAKLREYIVDAESGVASGHQNLQLKEEYFEPYGMYTYIVIQATDSMDRTSYKRLKIKLIPKLWDLTLEDVDGSRLPVDAIDKIKFDC